ncbi:4,5-DOPA dioxygenase extradiol [Enterovibrio sp. ZSDZ35]|uniref:4,5-DOPA dioxygenase extradiol n=1 Tax=Enterovibrio qingdaonensis TaxID=2899818 RepID=A0ABT5QGY4_9GAMM|nr:4,5-DOPA dioxygenase extradiol [Enterovibrio sp. ZSDZ35]MDD1780231.1 4,5-DOPA dioxygenase extradiol [Enterovibrio sp. ZSDZ35]
MRMSFDRHAPLPALFIGHGAPTHTLTGNRYTQAWKAIAEDIPVPKAILCISSHWVTNGSRITALANPHTLHDFGPIDERLENIHYPAPGAPDIARQIAENVPFELSLDRRWGLDHGSWTVLRHMYPDAEIPVLQLSLDLTLTEEQHYERGQQLRFLRDENILVVASGNVVHNLALFDRQESMAHPWALVADSQIAHCLVQGDIASLLDYLSMREEVRMGIPTPDHFWPLLYTLGMRQEDDMLDFPVLGLSHGSTSMRSVRLQSRLE